MAGSQRVQEYLQKHKIGNLFEELMAKVISDMPDEPVLHLIHLLEKKASRLGSKAHLRKSMGDLASLHGSSPEKAGTWSGGVAVAKDRPYVKPWQTNTKRQKNKTDASKGRSSVEKAGWDSTVKMTAASFDDIWEDGPVASQKARRRTTSPTPTSTKLAWADSPTQDEEFLFHSQGYEGPYRPPPGDDDPLAGEFTLNKKSGVKKPRQGTTSATGRVHGQKFDADRHKKELEKLILSKQRQNDSGIEDDRDVDPDDALVLMEDADDLRNEGVLKVKQSGFRIRQRTSAEVEPQVRVSICARCAKVMAGGTPSEPAVGASYGELPDYMYDTDRDFDDSRPQSAARASPGLTDEEDEFESVSQVTGPRRPVWQNEDSDNETLTARKGEHMFSPSRVPSRGRPMFSPKPEEAPPTDKNPLRATIDVYRSVDTEASERTLKGHDAFNKTWTPGVGQSNDYSSKEAEEKDTVTATPPTKEVTFPDEEVSEEAAQSEVADGSAVPQQDEDDVSAAVSLRGAGWSIPQTDYDSDASSVHGARVSGKALGKPRQYQGQY